MSAFLLFRGALDMQATAINEEMKIACAEALAALAREDVPDEVAAAYNDERLRFGPNYIIPVPFDPRLIRDIRLRGQGRDGNGRCQKTGCGYGCCQIVCHAPRSRSGFPAIFNKVRQKPKRMIFAEGEQEQVIRAAIAYKDAGLGEPVLIGRDEIVLKT